MCSLGAQHVIDYKTTPEFAAAVKHITQNQGVDYIFDPVLGGAHQFNQNLKALSLDAKWVCFGSMGGVKLSGEVQMARLLMQRASLLTSTLRNRSDPYKAKLLSEVSRHFTSNKAFKVVVDREFRLSEVARAHAHVESNRTVGKVVLVSDLL